MKKLSLVMLLFCFLLFASCDRGKETETTLPDKTVSETTVREETEKTETTKEETIKATGTTEMLTAEETAAETLKEETTSLFVTTEKVSEKEPEETKAEKSLRKIRNQIKKKNAYVAVSYIGYYEGGFNQVKSELKKAGITKKYPFIKDIKKSEFYSLEGNEVYAVVPKEGAELSLYEFGFNENGEGVKVRRLALYKDSKPIIIKGNISDIFPSFEITLKVGKKVKLSYNPSLSLENGKLQKKKGVYDFSPYDKLPFFEEVTEEERNEPFCGTWYGEAEYGNGGIASMTLTLNSDTTASYKYGDPFSDVIESFEGTWNRKYDALILNMEGGPVDTEGLSQDEAVYSLNPVFEFQMSEGRLILRHVMGDVILYNTDGAEFTFTKDR